MVCHKADFVLYWIMTSHITAKVRTHGENPVWRVSPTNNDLWIDQSKKCCNNMRWFLRFSPSLAIIQLILWYFSSLPAVFGTAWAFRIVMKGSKHHMFKEHKMHTAWVLDDIEWPDGTLVPWKVWNGDVSGRSPASFAHRGKGSNVLLEQPMLLQSQLLLVVIYSSWHHPCQDGRTKEPQLGLCNLPSIYFFAKTGIIIWTDKSKSHPLFFFPFLCSYLSPRVSSMNSYTRKNCSCSSEKSQESACAALVRLPPSQL